MSDDTRLGPWDSDEPEISDDLDASNVSEGADAPDTADISERADDDSERSAEYSADVASPDRLTDGVLFDGRTIRFDQAFSGLSAKAQNGDSGESAESTGGEADNAWPLIAPFDETDEPEEESSEKNAAESTADSPILDDADRKFLKIFDTPKDEKGEKRFERRFQTFFEPEDEHHSDGTSDGSAGLEDSDDSDDWPDEETVDEFIQREQEDALRENIDAINRNEDAESLFILGSKYDPDDDVNMPDDETAQRSPVSILEAMLFVGNRQNRPLELSKAVELMRNVTVEEARQAVLTLNRRYENRQSPYRILASGEDAYQMVLTAAADPVRERFGAKVREIRLSQKAIDVLAIVAYRQPVTLTEIQEERPNSGGVLSQLVKRGLVVTEMKTVERKQVPYYRTGERFLKVLGIDSLDELPMVDEIDYR